MFISNRQTAQDLREAAAVLEQKGWIQGHFRSSQGFCAVGALAKVTGGTMTSLSLDRQALASLALQNHIGVKHIPTWNDTRDRTREDVVKAMLGAADTVEVQ